MVQAGDDYGSIDSSVWIPEGEEKLTEARKAMGDVAVESDPARGGKSYRALNDPLAVYHGRGLITAAQMRAGYRLFAAWRGGCVAAAQYRHMNFGETRTATELGAMFWLGEDYRDAMASIRGVPERRAAYSVCVDGHFVSGIEGIGSERSARRHGMRLLVHALEDLQRHFKARREERDAERS